MTTTTETKATPAKAVKKAPAKAKRPELTSVANVVLVPLDDLLTDQNIREAMDEEGLRELARDIEARGLLQPIVVTPAKENKYQVVAGHRRAAAIRLTAARVAPAVVTKFSPADAKKAQLAENIQRADLSLLEEGRALLALRNEGMSLAELGELVNKSRAWVCKRIACVDELPSFIADLVEDGVTEDPEIILAMKDLFALDWWQAKLARDRLRAGEESRESLRELVKKAKEPKAPPAPLVVWNTGGEEDTADATQGKAVSEESEEEKAALLESARAKRARMQCDAWRLIEEAQSNETMECFQPFQNPLEPEARAYWKDVFGDATSPNGFEMMVKAAAQNRFSARDVLVVMAWAGMKRQQNLLAYPTEEEVDGVLRQFVEEFRGRVVSHAKQEE